METLYLLVEANEVRFAIPAESVVSVVRPDEIVPVPLTADHVAGLTALRSKVITVIDTMASIDGGMADVESGQSLVVVDVEGQLYGLAVDQVSDVCDYPVAIRKLGAAFDPGWSRVAVGLIEVGDATLAVVDPAAIVAGEAIDEAA